MRAAAAVAVLIRIIIGTEIVAFPAAILLPTPAEASLAAHPSTIIVRDCPNAVNGSLWRECGITPSEFGPVMFNVGPDVEEIGSSRDHGIGGRLPYHRYRNAILRAHSILHGNNEGTNLNIGGRGRSFIEISDARSDCCLRAAHDGGGCHCRVNDNFGAMSGIKFIPTQSNLSRNETALGNSDTNQSRRQHGQDRRKTSDGVCPEFLPPPLIVFGIAAAVFASGFYIQGRSRTGPGFLIGSGVTMLGLI